MAMYQNTSRSRIDPRARAACRDAESHGRVHGRVHDSIDDPVRGRAKGPIIDQDGREVPEAELRPFPGESSPLQRIAGRLLRLADMATSEPEVRAPRELRDLMAKFGIAAHSGNVRLPPLPPLWR